MGPSRISTSVPASHDERTSKVEKEKIVNFQSFFKRVAAAAFAVACVFVISAAAQQAKAVPRATPTMVIKESRPMTVAERSNVYCAGYVQTAPVDTSTSLVGGHNEQDQFLYSENNFVYINAGENKGVKVGDRMVVAGSEDFENAPQVKVNE